MDKKRGSTVFYRSFWEAIMELPHENQLGLYNAIFNFIFEEKESELTGIEKTVFILIKPQLEANQRKFDNGQKGGRPKQTKTKGKPNYNQSDTKKKGNENDNVNANENCNVDGINSHNEIFRELWKNDMWLESLCMRWKCEKKELQNHLNVFRQECIDKEELKVTSKDAKEHFINWVKKGNPIESSKPTVTYERSTNYLRNPE